MPFSPLRMLLFAMMLAFLIIVVQFGLISIAFGKLGLSEHSAYLLLISTLVGSMLDLPLFSLKADNDMAPRNPQELIHMRMPFFRWPPVTDRIMVTANVGGAVVPVAFSLYLIQHNSLNLLPVAAAVASVTLIARLISRPMRGIGIGMPILIAPVAAALIATLLDPHQRAPLSYIAGTLGVLIGADLLHLDDIRKLGKPFASIGGAGTFDGIYIAGLLAVLLA
jgi:uncharacterized membrane protein